MYEKKDRVYSKNLRIQSTEAMFNVTQFIFVLISRSIDADRTNSSFLHHLEETLG